MQIKELDLSKSNDKAAFEDALEDIKHFAQYKKRFKRDIRRIKSAKKDFFFFDKFRFGTKRSAFFIFGDIDKIPWQTLIEGGELEIDDDTETYTGWENDYTRNSSGYCYRKQNSSNGGYTLYVKTKTGKSDMKNYGESLQILFDEALGVGELTLKIVNISSGEDLPEDDSLMKLLEREVAELDDALKGDDLQEQGAQAEDVEKIINDWKAKYYKDDTTSKVSEYPGTYTDDLAKINSAKVKVDKVNSDLAEVQDDVERQKHKESIKVQVDELDATLRGNDLVGQIREAMDVEAITKGWRKKYYADDSNPKNSYPGGKSAYVEDLAEIKEAEAKLTIVQDEGYEFLLDKEREFDMADDDTKVDIVPEIKEMLEVYLDTYF